MTSFNIFDRIIIEIDEFFKTILVEPLSQNPSPADSYDECDLSLAEKEFIGSLIRIDHVGEICAQALYRGQAFFAKTFFTQNSMLKASEEEQDHLVWCRKRMYDLNSKPSMFNTFWYTGSFIIGALNAKKGDNYSFAFVRETEKQVMIHLEDHIKKIPCKDQKSLAILKKMYQDEKEHMDFASNYSDIEFNFCAKTLMKIQAKIMTSISFYL